jgi:hypothetical protein
MNPKKPVCRVCNGKLPPKKERVVRHQRKLTHRATCHACHKCLGQIQDAHGDDLMRAKLFVSDNPEREQRLRMLTARAEVALMVLANGGRPDPLTPNRRK